MLCAIWWYPFTVLSTRMVGMDAARSTHSSRSRSDEILQKSGEALADDCTKKGTYTQYVTIYTFYYTFYYTFDYTFDYTFYHTFYHTFYKV